MHKIKYIFRTCMYKTRDVCMSCASLIPRFQPGNEASHVHEITSLCHPSTADETSMYWSCVACTDKVRLCRTVLPVQKSVGLMAVAHSSLYPFVWLSHKKTSGAMMIKELFTESYTLVTNCSACIDMFLLLTSHLVTKYYTSLFTLSPTKGKPCSHSGSCLGEVLWRGRSRPKGGDAKTMCRILPGLPPQRDLSAHCWFIWTSESVEGTRMEPGGWQYRAMIYRLDYHHGNRNPNHI